LQGDQSSFEQEGAELGTSIARQLGTPALAPRPSAGVDTALTALPAPVVETHSVVTRTPPAQSRRSTIAWISATVLLLVAFISLSAVLSIVRPVRRLIAATSRIAKGDHAVRVERGGIKELDALAVAFNAMADELAIAKAAARDYQQSLEAKVTERTHQLEALAKHDPLTGLPNRRELFALLNAAIARARAARERVGVFFLDIDNFKYINDAMGHAFGDRLLLSFAQLLQSTTRSFGFAARLGGDEFTVVFERAARVEDIRAAGLRLVQAFQRPLSVDGRQLVVSVSVGVSIYPDHEQDAEALLKAADAALFRAKSLGRNQLATFTPELVAAAAAKFRTEQALRRAIDRGEFELLFQPELGVSTLQTALVEALIRWRLPDGRLATPHEFLSVAEESGLIVDINDWVLRSAMQAAAQWHHGCWPDARVAINVSPRQLLDHRFVERLEGLLREHRLPPQCIEIELTESVLQTGPSTIEALKYLRSRGVAIALDDFGTGYSSLASLEQLPLSRIKLDASLIARIDENPRSAAIARAIISLCEGLGLEITAEGIERPQQLAFLLRHRTMYLQGYLLAPPVAADELMTVMSGLVQRAEALLLDAQPPVGELDSALGTQRLALGLAGLRG
jgi:diguanylate cyclase (GGDEF)-like protein